MARDSNSDAVQLEITVDKLEALFSRGEICAAEIHCLNDESKKCIRNLCLKTCIRKSDCRVAAASINTD